MREAWIIDAVRSPRGRGKPGVGSLSHIHPQRCMAQVLNGLRAKVGFDPADIEDVVAGCGTGSGDHAHDIARMSVLDAGWPISVTGVTLHPSVAVVSRRSTSPQRASCPGSRKR